MLQPRVAGVNRRDAVVLATPVAGLVALAALPPLSGGVTLCPIAMITGVPCPGCGMTRAVSHLVNGDLEAAFGFHPLVIPLILLGAVAWAWFLFSRVARVRPIGPRAVNIALGAMALALVGVWAFRLVSGTLPPV
jgi:hypothetical protein